MTDHRLGARLRYLRQRRRLTLGQVAARAGSHREVVGAIERGERGCELHSLLRLCRAIGVLPRDVLVVVDTDPRWSIERGARDA